jgi:hypothetical protein
MLGILPSQPSSQRPTLSLVTPGFRTTGSVRQAAYDSAQNVQGVYGCDWPTTSAAYYLQKRIAVLLWNELLGGSEII